MTKPKGSDLQAGWGGGWIPQVSPGTPENSYRYAKNVELSGVGVLGSRQGLRRLLASAHGAAIDSVFAWRTSLLAESTIFFASAATLYSCTWASDTTLNAPTNLGVVSGLFPHKSTATFRDGTAECLYIAGNGLKKWSGAALTSPAGVPNVGHIWVANNRLFGITVADDTLYWSAIGNGDTLGIVASGGGFATVRAYGSSTGLVTGFALGATVVLVHDAGVSFFRGNTADDIDINAGLFGVATGIGAINRTAVAVFDTFAHIATRQGMYVVTEGGMSPLFSPDRPDIPITLNGGSLDGSAPPYNMRGFPNPSNRTVWWVMTDSAFTPVGVYVWHLDFKRWVAEYTFPASNQIPASACVAYNPKLYPILVTGSADGQLRATSFEAHATASIVYQDNVDTAGANGSTITCDVKCRRIWTGATFAEKQFNAAMLVASLNENTTVTLIETQPDGTNGSSTTFTQPSGVIGDVPLAYRAPLGGRGPFTDLTLTWSGSPKVTVAQIETEAKVLGERGA